MIVAGLQMDLAWEDPKENFRRADRMAAEAAQSGAKLVVMPEMFPTGFTMNAALAAESAGETRKYLSGLTRLLGIWAIGGYADPAEGKPRNAASVFGPNGREALRQFKIHPFTLAGEHEHYRGGDEVKTVDVDGLRVTPLVCYDLRFPEPFRAVAAETDLFVVIANWPERRRDAWAALLRARAIENQCFVLGVNRVGEGAGLPHTGDSQLVDPFGHVRASASRDPAVLVAPVDPEEVRAARDHFSFLADRRPDVYARLAATASDSSDATRSKTSSGESDSES